MKKTTTTFLIVFILISNLFLTASASTHELGNQLYSESAVLIDGDSGQILFEKNMHKRLFPASITKIMTALLALENGEFDDEITMSHDAVFSIGRGTSHIALDVDEKLTLEQALYALALGSANDAANGIAELIGGSMDNFALMMTERAKSTGAINTNFTNAHGLPDENHYTTAYDMAMITMEAIKLPQFLEIFGAKNYEMPPTNKQAQTRYFHCTNAMMVGKYEYEGLLADKTGWTTDARHTMVTIAQRNGRKLIAVVIKSQDQSNKYEDSTKLFDYGFNEFTKIDFPAKEIGQAEFSFIDADGEQKTARLYTRQGFSALIHKDLSKDMIQIEYSMDGDFPKVEFKIDSTLSGTMFSKLGEHRLRFELLPEEAADEEIPNDNTDSIETNKNPFIVFFQWIIVVFGGLVLLVIILRLVNVRRRILNSQRQREIKRRNK